MRSLRYYEEQGLLSTSRSPSGQRLYVESDVERVRLLQSLYGAGLSSRTIAEILPCVDSPSVPNSDAAWERLLQEREHLENHITETLKARDAIDALLATNRRHREHLAD